MGNKRFVINSLGCRSNQYEAQVFRDQLESLGYEEARKGECAELCIVNTCCVTQSAEQRSRYQIRQLAKKHPGAKIVVTGCLATRMKDIPEATLCIPNDQKKTVVSCCVPSGCDQDFSISHFAGHTRAFVKIQDGCDSFCSYCIIPFVRGRSTSRPVEEIVCEVKRLVSNGYKEVVLTGINIGDYQDESTTLSDLVKTLDTIDGLERLRLSSIDPDDIDDSLFEILTEGRTTCHSLHLVLQSGSNGILERMRRTYRREDFLRIVERFRSYDPLWTFTTDIIVGFPGETEEDFEATCDIVRSVTFAHAHLFPYSPRPGVASERLDGKVAESAIKKRREQLSVIAEESAFEARKNYVGDECTILIENSALADANHSFGRTTHFLPVLVRGNHSPHALIPVSIVGNGHDALQGEVV